MKLTQRQREQLTRPRPLLFAIAVGTFCSPWLLLFSANVYLAQQQAHMDDRAAQFFAQTPMYPGNLSAQQFDTMGAQLGLVPSGVYTLPIEIDQRAAIAFHEIEPALDRFLKQQSSKLAGPLDPLPPELQHYLDGQQVPLAHMQQHLLSAEPPQWPMSTQLLSDLSYPSSGFFNVRQVHKILLLSALSEHQQQQPQAAMSALEASWLLNQAIASRSDLPSQVSLAIISAQQAGILRHLPDVPTFWQHRLQDYAQQQPVIEGLRFETWLRYHIAKASWLPAVVPESDAGIAERIHALVANRFSSQAYFKLVSIDNIQAQHRALDQLVGFNVCATSQLRVEAALSHIQTAFWNRNQAVVPAVTAKRWQTAGSRLLALELSQYVLQVKQAAITAEAWPASFPDQPSQICPGEYWHYEYTEAGRVTLSFSKTLLSPSAIPLVHHIHP